MSVTRSSVLEGQVALVTGASRGIGAEIALTLAEAGATVAGTATSSIHKELDCLDVEPHPYDDISPITIWFMSAVFPHHRRMDRPIVPCSWNVL